MTFRPKFTDGSRPFKPSSDLKIDERRVTGYDSAPTTLTQGLDVSRQTMVLVSVSGITPLLAAVPDGWAAEIVVWRLKRENHGDLLPSGAWYVREVDTYSLDPQAVVAGRPQEYAYPTLNSENMFFQVRTMTANEALPDTWEINIAVSELGRRTDEAQEACCPASGAVSTSGLTIGEAIHDDPVIATGIQPMLEAQSYDGTPFPNEVSASGDDVRAVGSRAGVAYTMLTTQRGDATPTIQHDTAIAAADGGTAVIMAGAEAKTIDGAALPNGVAEGDAVRAAASTAGIGYTNIATANGHNTAVQAVDTEIDIDGGDNAVVMVGAEAETYNGAAMTEIADTDGDSTRVKASHYGVQYTMPTTQNGGATAIVPDETTPSDAAGGLANLMAGVVARATQAAAVGETEAVHLVSNLFRELITAAYDWMNQADRNEEIDPLDTRDVGDSWAITGATNAAPYYYYIPMQHFRDLTLHWLSNTPNGGVNTLTVGVSNQDDGTAPATCTYQDVTNQWFGAAWFTGIAYLERGQERSLAGRWVRLTMNASAASGAAWTIWARRLY